MALPLRKRIKKILRNWLIEPTVRDSSTSISVKTKYGEEVQKEILEKTKKGHEPSPYEVIQESFKIMETATLTDEQKKAKLAEIGASSEWSAFYDLQAFPPRESFRDNEELFLNVPYFKAGIFLRADMSVGVGIKKIADGKSDEETPQERFIKSEFDRLDLEKKLPKTCIYRDLQGNAYWYKEWETNPMTGKKRMKTISVLHPARVRIRLNKYNSLEKIGYAYLPPILVPGNYLQPVPMTLDDVIHFKGEEYDDLPYGYSKTRALVTILKSRWDMNVIEPIIYRHAAKPWIHFKLDGTELSDDQIRQYMSDMNNTLVQSGPESDLLTLNLWEATSFSGGQARNDGLVKGLMDDIDNQIFGELKIPETYFKPKGTTDRMILKQDDNFSKEMKRIQHYFGWLIKEELIIPMLEEEFGARTKEVNAQGEEVWNYEIPEIEWNDVLEIDEFKRNEDIRENLKVGILSSDEARKQQNLEDRADVLDLMNQPNPVSQPIESNPLGEFSGKRQVLKNGDLKLIIEEE